MTDIHIHAPVVHIHLDQRPTAPSVVVNGAIDPDKVAEQIRQIIAKANGRGAGAGA